MNHLLFKWAPLLVEIFFALFSMNNCKCTIFYESENRLSKAAAETSTLNSPGSQTEDIFQSKVS